MKEHLRVLELASRDSLPDQINKHSEFPIAVIRELIEAGYLHAIDASTMGGEAYLSPRITLSGREYLHKLQRDASASEKDLITAIERLRDMLVAVSTGGPPIDTVNVQYRELYATADAELRKRGIKNTNPFPDLWDWYGRWRSGDLPSYQSRRRFIAGILNPLLEQVREHATGRHVPAAEPTGWPKVDRALEEIRRRLAEAEAEEQFQVVGLLCRESLISLAQAVHDPLKHPPLDERQPSETDAKRMLEAYIAVELAGSTHEAARRHARAAYDLAVDLQHRRTATFRQAALCVEATSSLINVSAIVSGHRDPVKE